MARKSFSDWYNSTVLAAGLADYSPVKGCMVIMPYGYAIWENIQNAFDGMIKKAGVKNAYFPMFIPMNLLEKEKEHVEGFSPQLAVVTHGGGKKLEEPLAVRPTSETIMYKMYSKWIHSWRDLPLLINQWCNVVRWEKRTYLFLRTTEFLWQEGHTVHATHEDSRNMVQKAIDWYQTLYREYFALDGIAGTKSESEKFAGADTTTTYEMLMPDGKALQGCTSHDLGQNFSKVFDIAFQDENGEGKLGWQTSWGLSTRSIGALIMAHGDKKGLILPPKLAPTQVVLIPIFTDKNRQLILDYSSKVAAKLKGVRVEVDNSEQTPGWKFNQWELKGVPLRIEVGEREEKEKSVTLVRRDNGEKTNIKIEGLLDSIKQTLKDVQNALLKKSSEFLTENIREVKSYEEFKKIMKDKKGFIAALWCENTECEEKIKAETKASTRCLPFGAKKENGKCIYCGSKASHKWIFAQAY